MRDVDHVAAVAGELQSANPDRFRVQTLPRDRADQHAAAGPNPKDAVVAVLSVEKGEEELLGKGAAVLVVHVQTDQPAVGVLAEAGEQNGIDGVRRVVRDVVDDVDRETHFAEPLALHTIERERKKRTICE